MSSFFKLETLDFVFHWKICNRQLHAPSSTPHVSCFHLIPLLVFKPPYLHFRVIVQECSKSCTAWFGHTFASLLAELNKCLLRQQRSTDVPGTRALLHISCYHCNGTLSTATRAISSTPINVLQQKGQTPHPVPLHQQDQTRQGQPFPKNIYNNTWAFTHKVIWTLKSIRRMSSPKQ